MAEQHPHDHTTYVPGCFRCDLSRAEVDETNRSGAGERHDRGCAAGITNGAARCQCATPDADDASEIVLDGPSFGDYWPVDEVSTGLSETERIAVCICPVTSWDTAPGDTHTLACSMHKAAVERIVANRETRARAEALQRLRVALVEMVDAKPDTAEWAGYLARVVRGNA